MSRTSPIAVAASAAIHGALAALIFGGWQTLAVRQQPPAATTLGLVSDTVRTEQARLAEPDPDAAAQVRPPAVGSDAEAVPSSRLAAVAAAGLRLSGRTSSASAMEPLRTRVSPTPPATAEREAIGDVASSTSAALPRQPMDGDPAVHAAPAITAIGRGAAEPLPAPAVALSPETTSRAPVRGEPLTAAEGGAAARAASPPDPKIVPRAVPSPDRILAAAQANPKLAPTAPPVATSHATALPEEGLASRADLGTSRVFDQPVSEAPLALLPLAASELRARPAETTSLGGMDASAARLEPASPPPEAARRSALPTPSGAQLEPSSTSVATSTAPLEAAERQVATGLRMAPREIPDADADAAAVPRVTAPTLPAKAEVAVTAALEAEQPRRRTPTPDPAASRAPRTELLARREPERVPSASATEASPPRRSAPVLTPDTARLPKQMPSTEPPLDEIAGPALPLKRSPPPIERQVAALGWSGDVDAALDSAALAAVQSFVAPGAATGTTARDAIGAFLAGLRCARVRAIFDPESGELRLRGHVPDPATREEVARRLSRLVGDAIPLSPDLKLLPPPQCAALPLVAALGLPQSDAHENDPKVVGPDAHVREETFSEGERVELEVTAPEYPAYLYVDYFDAAGSVIHLIPNAFLETARLDAEAELRIGGETRDGAPFEMVVAPPFQKEIAVALATTAPLYEGTRPLVEPAAPYLDWLRGKVAAAQHADPGFRGEWAYFFINTVPGDI